MGWGWARVGWSGVVVCGVVVWHGVVVWSGVGQGGVILSGIERDLSGMR